MTLGDMHHNFYTASFLITLKIYTLQLSNCFLINESWDVCTAVWKLRCFLLNDSWDVCTATFKLLPTYRLSRYMHRNFQTTSFQWFLRNMHRNFQTASFLLTLERYVLQLSNCFLLNGSWDIYTATFTLLPSKWLLRYIQRNFHTASL